MRRGPLGNVRLGLAGAALVLIVATPRADAQAVIQVSDDVSFKLGLLHQGQADGTENAATGATAQDLYVRRIRLLVGGKIAKNVTFFLETDSPNLGKGRAGGRQERRPVHGPPAGLLPLRRREGGPLCLGAVPESRAGACSPRPRP